jgi:hypothetical protein
MVMFLKNTMVDKTAVGKTKVPCEIRMSLQPENLDLLVLKPHTFSVCTQIKNCGYVRPKYRGWNYWIQMEN